jgi:rhodanese-related sulfurtransferase
MDALANTLSQLRECILVDVRPHTEFVKQHIKGAIHLHLNSMQLRRLCKGICELDTVVADQNCKETLQKRFSADVEMVVYDENSNEQLVTPCIKSYSDVLRRGFQGTLHVLNGE